MWELFSFFTFYYSIITNNPKKYDIATGHPSSFYVAMTPVAFFVIYTLTSVFYIPIEYVYIMFLWIPIILGNLSIVNHVSNKGFRIKHEQERERKYEEELEREAERAWREFVRRFEERQRRQQEYEYRQQQRQHRENYYRQREREQQQYQRQRQYSYQQEPRNNNRTNAMKLMGLSEGFTTNDVKKAYRRLAKVHHPDLGGTQENFIRLTKAYDYLMK